MDCTSIADGWQSTKTNGWIQRPSHISPFGSWYHCRPGLLRAIDMLNTAQQYTNEQQWINGRVGGTIQAFRCEISAATRRCQQGRGIRHAGNGNPSEMTTFWHMTDSAFPPASISSGFQHLLSCGCGRHWLTASLLLSFCEPLCTRYMQLTAAEAGRQRRLVDHRWARLLRFSMCWASWASRGVSSHVLAPLMCLLHCYQPITAFLSLPHATVGKGSAERLSQDARWTIIR